MKTLTTRDVAARLGLYPRTITRLVRKGKFLQPLPFCRHPLLWDAETFEQWVRSQHGLPEGRHATAK
jgi:hypothetical protein